jgi:serine/threonine protein kinase
MVAPGASRDPAMSDQEPCPPEETFDALMRGGLTGDERTSFHAHVDRCRSCQLLLRELAGLIDVEAVLTGTCTSDYRLQARVGQGGMGVVYRAADVQLGRTVALKLPPRPEPDMDGIAEGSTAVSVDPARPAQPAQPSRPAQPARDEARFMREALITARLQHPGIVPIHQIGRWPTGEAFYTMKLISGRSLRELLDGARSLEERLALLPQVLAAADAVGYAHAQGVIHRDLKPANIMSGPFGETVVIDWGLAKQLDVDEPLTDLEADIDQRDLSLTSPGLVLGTPSYMAPEQARGDAVDARADVFALGAILYHLLAGVAPALSSRAAMTWPPGAPVDLIALVGKATAIDPRDRYPTANELADDLRRFHTGQLVRARAYSASTLLWPSSPCCPSVSC